MSLKRIQKFLVAIGLATLISVEGMQLYLVRDLLASFVVFCIFFGAVGIAILASFLLGAGIVRCFELVVAYASSLDLRQPVPSVVGFLTRGIRNS
jgi:hypothetical protein